MELIALVLALIANDDFAGIAGIHGVILTRDDHGIFALQAS